MPFFNQRRQRKTSRSPSPGRVSTRASSEPSRGDSVPLRSRNKRNDTLDKGTILPTTVYDSSQDNLSRSSLNQRPHFRASSPLVTTQPSNTCNNFLLGGHYYPGKDKKRRHMRRKALWYRIFCSSSWRIAFTTISVSYVFVSYGLLPMTSLILSYGQSLSGSMEHSGWQLNDLSLPVPSLEEDQAAVLTMQRERERLGNQGRMAILERVVPEWFHRNDIRSKKSKDLNRKVREDHKKNKLLEQHEPPKVDEEPVKIVSKSRKGRDKAKRQDRVEQKNVADAHGTDRNKTKVVQDHGINATTSKEQVMMIRPVLRTLQNMDQFVNQTSCPSRLKPQDIQTTLVIQASLNRIWVLEETCQRWKDPIVAVVATTEAEKHQNTSALLEDWKKKCPRLKLITYQMDKKEEKPEMYPVNHLRNIGLDAVETSHILLLDADFVPSDNLSEKIRTVLVERAHQRRHLGMSEEREAIVVPAFERVQSPPCTNDAECKQHLLQNSSFIPHTFDALRTCVSGGDCIVFQDKVNWEGHHSTNSKAWLNREWYDSGDNSTIQAIKEIKCFDSLRYEPYVVIRWCPADQTKPRPVAPYYDERFHGYGKNKIELVHHLRFMGYRFFILPEGFIAHNPHVESKAKAIWNDVSKSDLHAKMDRLYPEFLKELMNKYRGSGEHIVQACQR